MPVKDDARRDIARLTAGVLTLIAFVGVLSSWFLAKPTGETVWVASMSILFSLLAVDAAAKWMQRMWL
jgi:hypothetical protein